MIETHKLKTRGLNQVRQFLSKVDSQKERKFKISYHAGKTHYRSANVVSSPASRWLESVIEGLPTNEVEPSEIEDDLKEALHLTAVYLSVEKGEGTLNEFIETVKSQEVLTENFELGVDNLDNTTIKVDLEEPLPNVINLYYRTGENWIEITDLNDPEKSCLLAGEYRFEAIYSDKVIKKEIDTSEDSKVKLHRSKASQMKEGAKSKVARQEENTEAEEISRESEGKDEADTSDKKENSSAPFGGGVNVTKILKYGIFAALISGILLLFLPGLINDQPENNSPMPENTTNRTAQTVDDVFNSTRVAGIIDDRVHSLRTQKEVQGLNNLDSLKSVAMTHSQAMADNNYLGHRSPDGKTLEDRMEDENVVCGERGENIARETWEGEVKASKYSNSSELAESIFNRWINKTEERKQILNPKFKAHGIGVKKSSGEIFVSQVFCG